jgi:hypothetical protein
MSKLQTLLNDLKLGTPQSNGSLTLYPLRSAPGKATPMYTLAHEAFLTGSLEVTEVSDEGVVAELLAITSGELPILLIDGEELVGAKQNRIMNTDALLRPNKRMTIPVSCVEQGRWENVSPIFASGGSSPPMMRSKMSRAVSGSLRDRGEATSDQGEVWEDVNMLHEAMGTSSPTSAMSDAISQRRNDLEDLAEKLSCPADAVGVIVVINGQFAVMDVFDQPSTLAKLWDRLVVGYAMDAIARSDEPAAKEAVFNASDLLAQANGIECDIRPAVDLGEEWRFQAEQLVGSALVANGAAVHLSVFPSTSAGVQEDLEGSSIRGPRWRSGQKGQSH